jgi:hypothetical protein
MGETKEQKKTTRTDRKVSCKTPVSPCRRGRKSSGETNKKPTPAKISKPGEGGAKLRSSINAQVGLKSDQIAKALVNRTIAGDMSGARYVIQLSGADKIPVEPVKKPSGPT